MAYSFQIWLGREWDPNTGKTGRSVTYDGARHLTPFGPYGSGKGATFEIPSLLRLGSREAGGPLNIVWIDPKGQNAAVTARWRRSVSETVILNPFNLLGLGDAGFNPLATVASYEDAAAISDALQPMDGNDPFWPSGSRDLLTGLCLFEVREAKREGRAPSLENARGMLTGDLASFAKRMVATGDFQLASLAGRFLRDNRTTQSIVATAATAIRWLLSEPIQASLGENGGDWSRLKGPRPLTVYVILDADKLETFSVWLRLVVVSALNALYRQGGGGPRTLFLLSEFAQLGRLEAIRRRSAKGAAMASSCSRCCRTSTGCARTMHATRLIPFSACQARPSPSRPMIPKPPNGCRSAPAKSTSRAFSANDDPQQSVWCDDQSRCAGPYSAFLGNTRARRPLRSQLSSSGIVGEHPAPPRPPASTSSPPPRLPWCSSPTRGCSDLTSRGGWAAARTSRARSCGRIIRQGHPLL